MGVKTAAEYIQSLKDGRLIYAGGQKIDDISRTKHAALKAGLRIASLEYIMAYDQRFRNILVEIDESGEAYHSIYRIPHTADDLLLKRDIIQLLARTCYGLPGATHVTGIDALHTLAAVCKKIDAESGTNYFGRLESFMETCKRKDLGVACGMFTPDQNAENFSHPVHQDFSIKVIDKSNQGITVNGVMAHITFAPYVHEILIMPASSLREEQSDRAVAFAVPINTPGISLVMPHLDPAEEGNGLDHPWLSKVSTADSVVIFENVFIPVERIFMLGEYRYAGHAARLFAAIHRLSSDSCKIVELESLVGSAFLIAEQNGLEKYPHIREKLAQLVYYIESTDALTYAAILNCITDPDSGYVFPNPLLSNLAKYTFASNWHQAAQLVHDIAGGLLATMPSYADFQHPHLHNKLEPYFTGREGAPAEERIRALNLVRDLTMPEVASATIHGGGSLIMQKMAILKEADRNRYLSAARRAAGIRDKNPHPCYSELVDISQTDYLLPDT